MAIEVKSLYNPRLASAIGKMVQLNDIRRMWQKIETEVLPKFDSHTINFIIFDLSSKYAPDPLKPSCPIGSRLPVGVSFDEFQDMLKPEFSKSKNANISAGIMFDGSVYIGISNPLSNNLASAELCRIFQIQ